MSKTGFDYAPQGKPQPVVQAGEFIFAAAFLDHGHINGQVKGLQEAGAELKWVFDPDAEKVRAFVKSFPTAKLARSYQEILDDPEVRLVAAAAIPNRRGEFGEQAMGAGKDYFTDKSPFTTLEQLDSARKKVAETGRKYWVYFSERLHNEAAWQAGELCRQGAIGKILQVILLAPHRLSKAHRPDWFFDKEQYGGILTDIGSHQFEQFLFMANAHGGQVNFARVENFANPEYPGLEDFGEASLTLDNGVSAYCRLDWFTPDGSSSWGDGRLFVLGTEGSIEARKYMDVATGGGGGNFVNLVNATEEIRIPCGGVAGFPFFGRMILDILNGTEEAMTQDHIFMAAELSMTAQKMADQKH
ncbi:MAG: Gfo/Idh/MocA family protein [Verrucomicrobiales bacterium]